MNQVLGTGIRACLLWSLFACERPPENRQPVSAMAFSEAVQIIDTLTLEENPEVINVRIDVATDDGSGLVVADRAERQVRLYSRDGQLLWFGGKKGMGPGEFTSLVLARRMPDGSLLCAERNASFTVFDIQRDSVVRTVPTEFSYVEDIDVIDEGIVAVTAMIEGNRAGPRVHLWGLREDRVTSSFFSPFDKAKNKAAAMFAEWTKVSRRGDSLAVVFATSDTVYVFSLDGSEARKIPLPSRFFRQAPKEEPNPSLSIQERIEWIGSFDLVADVWWLSTGNILVQYQDIPPDPTLNDRHWHLLAMDPTGRLLAEVRNTPRAYLVEEDSGLIFFQDPSSAVPSDWLVGKPLAW